MRVRMVLLAVIGVASLLAALIGEGGGPWPPLV